MEFLSGMHPRVVHFPIVLFLLYFVFETAGTILKKDFLSKSAYVILVLGIISTLASVLTGNQAFDIVKNILQNNTEKLQLIDRHENYATWTLWYFTGLFFYRTYLLIKKKWFLKYQILFIILGIIGCLLIVLTGFYGGDLVFKYGIGIK